MEKTSEINSRLPDQPTEESEEDKHDDFLLIEDGAEIRRYLQLLNTDQIHHAVVFSRELDSLWRLIKDFMRLAGPTLICLVSLLLTRFVVSKRYQPMVLSSLLGCAVAIILVYSTPFILSFQRHQRVRHERVKILAEIIELASSGTNPIKVDSHTQTSYSDVPPSPNPSGTDVETIENPPTSCSSGTSASDGDNAEGRPSIEVIGYSDIKEPNEVSENYCQDCGDNLMKTCDCCARK